MTGQKAKPTGSFAKRLKEIRESRNLLQSDVARELGIVTTTYSNWEQGRTLPALTYLPALARFFGVTTDYLLGVSKEDTIDEVTKLMKKLPKSSQAAIECLIEEMLKKK